MASYETILAPTRYEIDHHAILESVTVLCIYLDTAAIQTS